MELKEFGEIRLIEWIRRNHCGARAKPRDRGIGDDCAVIRSMGGSEILVTTDSLVEDVHFSLSHVTPESIGAKSVLINLSDIAAMGGNPEALFLNLGFPPSLGKGTAFRIISGIHRACTRYGVSILGGDTCAAPAGIFISITVIGRMRRGSPVLRSGARISDILCLTGTVGASSFGLELLRGSRGGKISREVLKRAPSSPLGSFAERAVRMFCEPLPHLKEGRFIAEHGFATAMIDVSDGLSTDLHNLCKESRVGARIHETMIPVDPSVSHFTATRKKALEISLSGGEDYCLLAAVPRGKVHSLEREFRERFSRPLFRIGEIVAPSRGIKIVSEEGRVRALPRTGYEHFRY